MDFSAGKFVYLSYKHDGKLFDYYDQFFFFLNKYRLYIGDFSEVIAYSVLPDGFHFLIETKETNQDPIFQLQKLRKKIFFRYKKNIDLDQLVVKELTSEFEIEKNINSIHFLPVKHGFVSTPDEWEFSSYPEYVNLREGTLPKTDELKSKYEDVNEIRYNTENLIDDFDMMY